MVAHFGSQLIRYTEEFFAVYRDMPRRWAALRASAPRDEELAALLLRLAVGPLHKTALLILSGGGAPAGNRPSLYLVLPDWVLREKRSWHSALLANQQRRVTANSLYRAMWQIAFWLDGASSGSAPDTAGGTSIFEQLPERHATAGESFGGARVEI